MVENAKVLIIDDDDDLRFILKDLLSAEGFSVTEAVNGALGLNSFRSNPPDSVLLDLNMPLMNGFDTLDAIKQINPKVPVIILTAHGDIPTAVEAIKNGAYDFTLKPPEFDRLILLIKRAIEHYQLEIRAKYTQTALAGSLENMFGKSSLIKKTIESIQYAAQTDFSVIIQGETGTGKTFVAEAIHNLSKRSDKPFIRVDIGLLPDSLIESELFGYKKGAFTNALNAKIGFFEAADSGTIFIDEIENMSSAIQSKLLTLTERKEVYPIGSTSPTKVDIRIIAATNKNIRQSVSEKEFRADLFFRLGEFIITIPPLRERVYDVPFFANKFLAETCSEMKKQIRGVSEEALVFLSNYAWPGNLRELKNVIRKAVLCTDTDVIDIKMIEPFIIETDSNNDFILLPLKTEIRELEKKRISEALMKTDGNKTRASVLLGISYKSFCEKLKEYQIN